MTMQFLKLFGTAVLLTFLTIFVIGFSTGTITVKRTYPITDSKDEKP